MAEPVGKRRWAIAEGYIPGDSTGEGPAFVSHETACILNAGDEPRLGGAARRLEAFRRGAEVPRALR